MPVSTTPAAARFVALAQKLQHRRPDWTAVESSRRRAKASTRNYVIERNREDVLSESVSSDYDSEPDAPPSTTNTLSTF
jgi:hypothetical protein